MVVLKTLGNFLMVQWLELHISRGPSLIRELRSHKPEGRAAWERKTNKQTNKKTLKDTTFSSYLSYYQKKKKKIRDKKLSK